MTLAGYANIHRRLTEFARHEYGLNIPPDTVLELPLSDRARPEKEQVTLRPDEHEHLKLVMLRPL